MSHMVSEIVYKMQYDIDEILNAETPSVHKLIHLASVLRKGGDDEAAKHFLGIARDIELGEWAYDESINN